MADRPILFSAPMVQAILREIQSPGAGKTQTRRVMKPQPDTFQIEHEDVKRECFVDTIQVKGRDHLNITMGSNGCGVIPDYKVPYAPGDRLWMREAWCLCGQMNKLPPREVSQYEPVGYLADGNIRVMSCEMMTRGRTRASMHMPRWASRLTLNVTEVRVQRLQDISEADAVAEGITQTEPGLFDYHKHAEIRFTSAKAALKDLWDSINGKPRTPDGPDISWAANPWVVAVSFRPHLCNIDQMSDAA